MLNVHPTLGLPPDIATGLQIGKYERVGGVIREVGSKQIVAWLRDVAPEALTTLSLGLQVVSFIGVLNLAVSVVGFGLVLSRLNKLEARLKEIQAVVASTARKIDLMIDGEAYAALKQATLAIQSELPQNRERFAHSALDGLLKVQTQISGNFADTMNESRYVSAGVLYQSLCLIYVAEILCYLELGENRQARVQVNDHYHTLVRLSQELYTGTLNQIQYPILSEAVVSALSWDRIVDLHRWIKPDSQTDDLLIALLPKANAHAVEGERIRKENESSRYKRRWQAEEQKDQDIVRLQNLEAIVEDTRRFGAYGDEIDAMLAQGKSFGEWRDSTRKIETPSAEGVLCLRVVS